MKRHTAALGVIAAILGAIGVGGGCTSTTERPACATGSSIACACADGSSGTQTCVAGGTYEPCACGAAAAGGDAGGVSGDGPTILDLSTNLTKMTPTDSLVVTAVVTDVDGIQQVVGGTLGNPGGGTYGAFQVSTTSGAWSLTLSWSALQSVASIDAGVDGVSRSFEATFFDQKGHTTKKAVSVLLTCGDGKRSLCAGACADLLTDEAHCGVCATSCTGVKGAVCADGKCASCGSCNTNAECQLGCAAAGSGTHCCDTKTHACFAVPSATCP